MLKKRLSKAQQRVVIDEAEAETRYIRSIVVARDALKAMQEDQLRSESARVAAAETDSALCRIEEARLRATAEDTGTVAKHKFWEWLTGRPW